MLRPDPEFAQNRVECIGDLVALDKDPVGIEHGCFLPRVPAWAQKPTHPWIKDVWDFYLMGWPVPEGKLLTYEASAAKQAIRTYTLNDREANLALTVYGDGETTTARCGQFKDNQYYLYLLDTLD